MLSSIPPTGYTARVLSLTGLTSVVIALAVSQTSAGSGLPTADPSPTTAAVAIVVDTPVDTPVDTAVDAARPALVATRSMTEGAVAATTPTTATPAVTTRVPTPKPAAIDAKPTADAPAVRQRAIVIDTPSPPPPPPVTTIRTAAVTTAPPVPQTEPTAPPVTTVAPPPPTAPPTTAPPASTPNGSTSSEAVALTNAERAAAGLPALAENSALASAALAHSIDQATMRTMTHTGSDGSNAGTRIARAGFSAGAWGENVAAGYGSAASVVAGWMGSPGHRDNILNGAFTQIGVAVAYSDDGTPYWTMVLAG
jgi:uncharacterized protein YkwD